MLRISLLDELVVLVSYAICCFDLFMWVEFDVSKQTRLFDRSATISEQPALARLETIKGVISCGKIRHWTVNYLPQSNGLQPKVVATAVAAAAAAPGTAAAPCVYSEGTSCGHWEFGGGYEKHLFWKEVQHETTGTKMVVQWWDVACRYGCKCTNDSCPFQHSSEAAELQVVGELWRPASSQRQWHNQTRAGDHGRKKWKHYWAYIVCID